MSIQNLVGKSILGKQFVQDPKDDWVKVDGVAIGESPQFGYNTFKNNSIGNLLDQLATDSKVVVVIYDWASGNAYVKSGFNLNSSADSNLNSGVSSFVYKPRVTQGMVTTGTTPQLPQPTKPTKPVTSQQPKKICSPFIDVCAWPTFNMIDCAKKTGNKYFTLAFIIADGSNKPSFGGGYPLNSNWYLDQIKELRASGGDVIVSFGGAAGSELASVITDINLLVAAYQSVIDLYSCKTISFDIEGGSIATLDSIDRRNKAIVILQKKNVSLKVNYVLPVMPDGLDYNGLALVKNAKQNGVVINCVELMTMDFGQHNQQMGQAAISAAKNTKNQLVSCGYTNTTIGIIPMIGVNDTAGETFTLQNSKEVSTFAKNTSYISSTSFWSTNRDKYQQNDNTGPLYANSNVSQKEFEFLITLM